MTYLTLLYSPSLDEFHTDCNCLVYDINHMCDWIRELPGYYNSKFGVEDFYIISITKLED